jgi:hypothetical protein
MEEQPDGSIIPVDPSELPSDYFTTPPAQPAPVEPVACVACEGNPKWGNIPCAVCGTTPPAAKRQWVELTELQLDMLVHRFGRDPMKLVIELTQELKEMNT